ncbi:MAG: hypothetical protein NVS3B21_11010 [Acidimicrobiales bacterium]
MPWRRPKEADAKECLFDPVKVDVVSVSSDGKTVTAVIAQPGPWTGSDAQINSIQQKIHNYVGFVLDGEMLRLYPETKGLSWVIAVDCHLGPPDPRTATVLDQVAIAVERYGGRLVLRPERL